MHESGAGGIGIRTTTDRPLARFVTRTQVPSSSDG